MKRHSTLYCHGMTKSVRKTNRLTKMLFLLFWPVSCVSLISLIEIWSLLYKITWKLPFCVRQIRCPFSGSTSCTKLLKEQLIFLHSPCIAWLLQGSLPATHFFCFYSCPCFGQTKWCKDPCTPIHLDALSSMPCCLPFTIAYSYAQVPKCFQCLIGIPQYMDHLLNLLLSTCGHFP